jgi:hypothetical protein
MLVISIVSFLMGTQVDDPGHRILQENIGNSWNMEAVLLSEIFRWIPVLSGRNRPEITGTASFRTGLFDLGTPVMPSHLSDLVGSVDVASTDAPVGDVDDSIGGAVNIVNDIGAGDAGGVLSYGEITDNLSASTSSTSDSPHLHHQQY